MHTIFFFLVELRLMIFRTTSIEEELCIILHAQNIMYTQRIGLLIRMDIVYPRLANSPTFQRAAWEGTELAKQAAAKAIEKAKASGILEEATHQASQAVRRQATSSTTSSGWFFSGVWRRFK
jgi:hypothetical protein